MHLFWGKNNAVEINLNSRENIPKICMSEILLLKEIMQQYDRVKGNNDAERENDAQNSARGIK